jgi:hypothetical protein
MYKQAKIGQSCLNRFWLQVKDILARQDAIQELMEVAAEAAMEARKVFAGNLHVLSPPPPL